VTRPADRRVRERRQHLLRQRHVEPPVAAPDRQPHRAAHGPAHPDRRPSQVQRVGRHAVDRGDHVSRLEAGAGGGRVRLRRHDRQGPGPCAYVHRQELRQAQTGPWDAGEIRLERLPAFGRQEADRRVAQPAEHRSDDVVRLVPCCGRSAEVLAAHGRPIDAAVTRIQIVVSNRGPGLPWERGVIGPSRACGLLCPGWGGEDREYDDYQDRREGTMRTDPHGGGSSLVWLPGGLRQS
jgi:hypothetical protein